MTRGGPIWSSQWCWRMAGVGMARIESTILALGTSVRREYTTRPTTAAMATPQMNHVQPCRDAGGCAVRLLYDVCRRFRPPGPPDGCRLRLCVWFWVGGVKIVPVMLLRFEARALVPGARKNDWGALVLHTASQGGLPTSLQAG